MSPGLEHDAAHVLEDVAEVAGEAGGERTVDHAMVVRHADRQHQPWLELVAVPHRRHLRTHDAEDRDLGRVGEDYVITLQGCPTEAPPRRGLHLAHSYGRT